MKMILWKTYRLIGWVAFAITALALLALALNAALTAFQGAFQ